MNKQEYFEHPGLNQSALKDILSGPAAFKKENENPLYYEEKDTLVVGEGVDTLLTEGVDEFRDKFHVSTLSNIPSQMEMSITNYVFDNNSSEGKLEMFPDLIITACEAHEWQSKWKEETKVKKIVEKCSDYYDELIASKGKQVLNVIQKQTVEDVANSLRFHQHTKDYFDIDEAVKDNPDIEVVYQGAIFFEYKGVACKALLDKYIVNHGTETLTFGKIELPGQSILPLDIKTTAGYANMFPAVAKSLRYDIQAAWYTLALSKKYPHYRILPFKFIVESTKFVGVPRVYTVTNEDLLIARYGAMYDRPPFHIPSPLGNVTGAKFLSKPRVIKGFEQALDDYLWYQEYEWVMEREVAEAKGDLLLELYG